MIEAIILAGGFGTRLATVVHDIPKSMAPIKGRPFLEYLFEYLNANKVDRVVLAVGYKKECIMNYFGNHYKDIQIMYSVEDQPLFTGGAVKQAMKQVTSKEAFVINGDTYFNVKLLNMFQYYHETKADICIAIKQLEKFSRFGEVKINSNNDIYCFTEKQYCEKGYINGGIYLLSKTIFNTFPPSIFSLENDFFPSVLQQKTIKCFVSSGQFIDIGIPEDYKASQEILELFK